VHLLLQTLPWKHLALQRSPHFLEISKKHRATQPPRRERFKRTWQADAVDGAAHRPVGRFQCPAAVAAYTVTVANGFSYAALSCLSDSSARPPSYAVVLEYECNPLSARLGFNSDDAHGDAISPRGLS
jgi:hypothetical protein